MNIKTVLKFLVDLYQVIIFVRVLFSFFPLPRNNNVLVKINDFIYSITEPVLAPIRNLIQKNLKGKSMMIDFSPLIVMFLLFLISGLLK